MKASRKDVERRTYRLKLSEVEMIHLHGLVRDHVPTSKLNSRIYSVLEAALTPEQPFYDYSVYRGPEPRDQYPKYPGYKAHHEPVAYAGAAIHVDPVMEWRYGMPAPTWP